MSQRSSRSRMPLWLNKAMWIMAPAEVRQSSSSVCLISNQFKKDRYWGEVQGAKASTSMSRKVAGATSP